MMPRSRLWCFDRLPKRQTTWKRLASRDSSISTKPKRVKFDHFSKVDTVPFPDDLDTCFKQGRLPLLTAKTSSKKITDLSDDQSYKLPETDRGACDRHVFKPDQQFLGPFSTPKYQVQEWNSNRIRSHAIKTSARSVTCSPLVNVAHSLLASTDKKTDPVEFHSHHTLDTFMTPKTIFKPNSPDGGCLKKDFTNCNINSTKSERRVSFTEAVNVYHHDDSDVITLHEDKQKNNRPYDHDAALSLTDISPCFKDILQHPSTVFSSGIGIAHNLDLDSKDQAISKGSSPKSNTVLQMEPLVTFDEDLSDPPFPFSQKCNEETEHDQIVSEENEEEWPIISYDDDDDVWTPIDDKALKILGSCGAASTPVKHNNRHSFQIH